MKKYLALGLKAILRIRLYWLLMFAVSFSILMPGLLNYISQGLSLSVYEEQLDTFGEYQYIAYIAGANHELPEFEQQFSESLYPEKSIEQAGYMYKLGLGSVDEIAIDIGYVDPIAWKLSNAKLLRGRLPEKESEIALSDTKLYELNAGTVYDIGDVVNVSGRDFILKGIYAEFGTRWVGGEDYRFYRTMDGLVGTEDARDIWNNNSIKMLAILMSGTAVFDDIEMQDAKNIFHNFYIDDEYAKNMYQLPQFLIPVIIIMCALLLISIYLLIIGERKSVYKIYCNLGFEKREIKRLQFMTFLICNLTGLVCGILELGIGVAVLPCFFSFKWLCPDIQSMGKLTLIIGMVHILTMVLGLSINAILNRKRKHTKGNRMSWAVSYICTPFYSCFVGFSSVIILITFHVTTLYQLQYESRNIPVLKGEMGTIQGRDYDFELRAVNTTAADSNNDLTVTKLPDDSSGIHLYLNSMYYGMGDDDLVEFAGLAGVSNIKVYRENETAMVHIKDNVLNSYIDASDFIFDGQYDPKTFCSWNEYIQNDFILQDKLLVNSKLLGCPDEDLMALSNFAAEGVVNLEKLKTGEEVILIIPKFKLTDTGQGYISMKRLLLGEDPDDSYFADDTFAAGDVIDFYSLQPHNLKLSHGAIPGNLVKENFEMINGKVKVGAIINDYVGWFTNDNVARAYTIVMHNDAFAFWGLNETYSRMRIYTDGATDEEEITRLVYSKYRNMQLYMDIENRLRESRGHRDYIRFVRSIRNITIFIFGFITLCVMGIYIMMQILTNKRKLGLFFICGLTSEQLFFDFIKYNIKLWIVNVMLFLLVFYVVVSKLLQSFEGISYRSLLMSAGGMLLIPLISAFPCVWYLRRQSIHQLLK